MSDPRESWIWGGKTWTRLEPLTRNAQLTESVRAEVRDPAWLLGRQWQVGEFALEDAGSPVETELSVRHDRLTAVRFRDGESVPYDPVDDGPLEAVVEREGVQATEPPTDPLRVEAGQQFLRVLARRGVTDADGERFVASDFATTADDSTAEDAVVLAPGEEDVDAAGRRFARVVGEGRSLDGYALYRAYGYPDFEAFEAAATGPTPPPLPDGLDRSDGTALRAYWDAVVAYREWYRDLYDEPTPGAGDGAGDAIDDGTDGATADGSAGEAHAAWDPARLEYRFEVAAGGGEGETVLSADEYPGGRLDWYAFTAGGESLAASTEDSEVVTVRTTPTNVSFPGMPAPRWWELEDAATNLETLSAAPENPSRLLFLEFALLYGNDWFTLPVRTPVGSLSTITDLRVTDSFGVTTTDVDPVDDGWNLFALEVGDGEKALFLPPTLDDVQESEPVERVLFARDEMANLAFGVEQRVEGPAGPVDRDDHRPPRLGLRSLRPADDPADEVAVLENVGTGRLDVEGWTVASDDGTAYEFPRVSLAPGASVSLHTGAGRDDQPDLYWDRSRPVWTDAAHVVVRNDAGEVVERTRVPRLVDGTAPAYRLATAVPDHWYPLVPTRPADGEAIPGAEPYRFRLGILLDEEALADEASALPTPRGEVLADLEDVDLFEEEVTRAGVEVRRTYQLARWLAGGTHLWSGRRAGLGHGEGSSGLRFDVLDE